MPTRNLVECRFDLGIDTAVSGHNNPRLGDPTHITLPSTEPILLRAGWAAHCLVDLRAVRFHHGGVGNARVLYPPPLPPPLASEQHAGVEVVGGFLGDGTRALEQLGTSAFGSTVPGFSC